MPRFLGQDHLAAWPPSAPPPDAAELAAERIRHIPGVTVLWWHGSNPFFASARHCGERHVAAARTLADALLQLEEDLRARNRDTIREAFRLL